MKFQNLININGINNGLILKIKTVNYRSPTYFDVPFPNKCIGVFITDITSGVDGGGTVSNHAILQDTITKSSFRIKSSYGGTITEDTFTYLAIGY